MRGRPRGEDDAGRLLGWAGLDSGPGSAERGDVSYSFSFLFPLPFFLGLLSGDMHGVGGFIAFSFFFLFFLLGMAFRPFGLGYVRMLLIRYLVV